MDFNILYPIAWGWNFYSIKHKSEPSKTTSEKKKEGKISFTVSSLN